MRQAKMLKAISTTIVVSLLISTPVSYAETSYTVKSTDSLSRIVNKFYKDSKLTRHQKFIALLAENPKAFRLGNINYLKRGHTLVIPNAADLLMMEKSDAINLVSEHNDNVKRGKKVKIPPPFDDYTPKAIASETKDIKALSERQQTVSKDLKKVNLETDALRARLNQLTEDQKAMDAEIEQLDTLLKQ